MLEVFLIKRRTPRATRGGESAASEVYKRKGYSFNLNHYHPNCIAPNKRPMHTIIPGMLTKGGSTVMPFGVMGGHYQSFGHAYFLTNIFENGLDLQEAIDLPRLFPTIDGPVEIES